jgi:hypothetical protein
LRLLDEDFKTESPIEGDSLGSFKTEEPIDAAAVAETRRPNLRNGALIGGACAIVLAAVGFGLYALRPSRTAPSPVSASLGTAVFTSLPDGASIIVDGVARGTTPVKLSIAAGQHSVTIKSGELSRTLPLTVDAGAVVSQYVELAQTQPLGGRLEIGSDPPGAEVRIDGALRGISPLAIADMTAGPHRVTVSSGDTVVNRTVTVTRGMTATVVVSTGGTLTGSAGWLTVEAPFEMEVFEGQQLVGTTRSDRIMLPVGSHDLDLRNTTVEFAVRRTVKIVPGKTLNLSVTLPSGKLSVNAVPWAEVSIDGRAAGTTPLGNLTVPVGSHEVLWRHPQFGERRQTVTVKAQTPTRVGVDFSK